MSLEGNLTAFGLSEILQLIAVQQKSGMLAVTSQDRSKVLFFRDGQVISTRDRRRKTKDPLRDYLTRYGILSREELIRITQISAQSKLDLTDIIISEKFLDGEQLRKQYRNHIQEETHELLTWEQCSYKFIPGTDIIEGIKDLGSFNIEGLLMESMRRIDEFPGMVEILPDLNTRVVRNGEIDEDIDLSTNEKLIYDLLDGEKTLTQLIARGTMPRFEVYEALKHLNDKSLLDITIDPDAEALEQSSVTKRKTRKTGRRNPIPAIAAVVLFIASLGWGIKSAAPHVLSLANQGSRNSDISKSRLEEEIRWRLEAYRATEGGYPSALGNLKSAGLASDAFLDQVSARSFRYHLTADGRRYTLL